VAYGRIHHDAPDPAFESAFKFKLAYVLVHLDKGILQHILCFHGIPGIAQAYGHHLTGISVKQHALAAGVLFNTTPDQLIFFRQMRNGSLGNDSDTLAR
jgi:hypothetical protein